MLLRTVRNWFVGRRTRPQTRTTCLGLETLEARDTPSALQFASNVYAVGLASLNNSPSASSYQMARGGASGVLATRYPSSGYSLAEATSSLSYSDYGAHSKVIEMMTKANASGNYKYATSQVHLTENGYNAGPSFVTMNVVRTSGESASHRVLVTLNASYRNTNITSSTGHNFVQVSVVVGGKQTNLLLGNDTVQTPGGQTYRGSYSFYVTSGQSFRIAEIAYSYAYANTASGSDVVLSISTRDV
jgi:hypothetical protein